MCDKEVCACLCVCVCACLCARALACLYWHCIKILLRDVDNVHTVGCCEKCVAYINGCWEPELQIGTIYIHCVPHGC